MKISVIIATKDRFEDVLTCLKSIFNQPVLPNEVIIVDSSDKVGLENIIKQNFDFKIKYIHSKPGLTFQRNVGIKYASGDLVSFFDDDVILDKKYFENIVKIFEKDISKKIGGVTGKIVNQSDMKLISKIYRKIFCLSEIKRGEVKPSWSNNAIDSKIEQEISVQWLQGANQTYRREVFLDNLFDEALKGYCYMEDVDFSYRVGKQYHLLYSPFAKCIHNHQSSPTTRLKKREKQFMFMINYHYLFKKNMKLTSRNIFCHYWSFLGFIVRAVFFERNIDFLIGTLKGIFANFFGKNPLLKRL